MQSSTTLNLWSDCFLFCLPSTSTSMYDHTQFMQPWRRDPGLCTTWVSTLSAKLVKPPLAPQYTPFCFDPLPEFSAEVSLGYHPWSQNLPSWTWAQHRMIMSHPQHEKMSVLTKAFFIPNNGCPGLSQRSSSFLNNVHNKTQWGGGSV